MAPAGVERPELDVAEHGVEQRAAVGDPSGDRDRETRRGVVLDTIGRQSGEHDRVDEGGKRARCAAALEAPRELQSRLHPRAQVERHGLALDQCFERARRVVEGHDRARARPVRLDRGGAVRDLGDHGRAAVVGIELAHLPLPGQHPRRVAHLGAQPGGEVVRAESAAPGVPNA